MINKNFLKAYFSEFIGTALLVLIGLSAVIFINGKGSPVLKILPNPGIRRAISGFLFGTTGCLITLSPVGKISGAHINPIISITFWLRKNMQFKNMLGFIAAQMSGAALGCLPLLFWGDEGKSMYLAQPFRHRYMLLLSVKSGQLLCWLPLSSSSLHTIKLKTLRRL